MFPGRRSPDARRKNVEQKSLSSDRLCDGTLFDCNPNPEYTSPTNPTTPASPTAHSHGSIYFLKRVIDLLVMKYGANSHSGTTCFSWIGSAARVSAMNVPYFRSDAATCTTCSLSKACPHLFWHTRTGRRPFRRPACTMPPVRVSPRYILNFSMSSYILIIRLKGFLRLQETT